MSDYECNSGVRAGVTAESLIEAVLLIETLGGSVTVYMPDGRAIGVSVSDVSAPTEAEPAPAAEAPAPAPAPAPTPAHVERETPRPTVRSAPRRAPGSAPQPIERPGTKLRSAPSYSTD